MIGRENPIINEDIKKSLVNITQQIEEEKKNAKPDEKKMKDLMYQQLIKGMYLNTNITRNYNPY